MYDMKNMLCGTNNRLDIAEKNISEPEDIIKETIQNEKPREKNF